LKIKTCCEGMGELESGRITGNYGRTHMVFERDGKILLDMSDGEYGTLEITYCPRCGKKVELARTMEIGPQDPGIGEALAYVGPGGTVNLRPGDYWMHGPVTMQDGQSVIAELSPEGKTQVRIRGVPEGEMPFHPTNYCTISGIDFTHMHEE